MIARESLATCFFKLIIKEKLNDYKTSEIGEDEVCEAMREYAAKSFNSGMAKGTAKALLDLVNKGIITLDYAFENSGLPKEEFISIAKSLGYNI